MSDTGPTHEPSSGAPPPGTPVYPPHYPARPEGRPTSFYVAIFLALLLLVSGALNLLLLLFSAIGSATAGFGGAIEDEGYLYEMVAVGGDREAEVGILRIPIVGAITEAASPLLGSRGGAVSQVRRALRAARRTSSIKGVLIEVDSPGGGVTDSDEIHRLIAQFKEETGKPVLALFGDMAASGGYYVAAACDRIMARPTSITGSIGVILSSLNYKEAMEKIGLKQVTIMSEDTPYKDMLSPTREMTDVERAKLEAIVQEMYERFLDVVDAGRPNLSREQVKRLATGEIYSALQAKSNGLVDAIGRQPDANAMLRQMMGPDVSSVRIVEHRRRPTLTDMLFGIRRPRVSVDTAIAQLLRSSTGPRLLYFWPGGR